MHELLKATIQIKVSKKQARKFIEHMASQGYEPVLEKKDEYRENYYFRKDGKTSLHYEVFIMGKESTSRGALIGVRPR